MSPARWSCLMLLAALLVTACSGPQETPAPEPVAEVTLTKAAEGNLPVIVRGYGIIQFDPSALHALTSEIEARVLEVTALPGETVPKGAVILRLGPSSRAGVEIARARREAIAAQAAAARATRLRGDGMASDGDVEAAETKASDLANLAQSLEHQAGSISDLRSPISGIVDAILVKTGQLVASGAQLASIASPQAIQAKIGVEIEDAARLRRDASVKLVTLDNARATADSSIRMLDHRVDPATRMATIVVSVPPGQGLLPGEAVRAEIIADTKRGVVLVPRESVFTDESGFFVFVAADGKALLRHVETGVTTGSRTEIVSGLAPGETVIVEGAAVLSTGMKILDRQTNGESQQ